jgi:SEC-C motif-containing protein
MCFCKLTTCGKPGVRNNDNAAAPDQIRAWAASCEWLGLQIISTEAGQENDSEGLVSFVALYRHDGNFQQHHEVSLFHQVMGRWFYVDHRPAE